MRFYICVCGESMAGPLSFNNRVMTLVYRVEPGCLGPDGIKYVEEFCNHSNKVMAQWQEAIQFFFTPRYDKSRPEVEYKLLGKTMKREQVESYIERLGITLEDFEADLGEKTAELIEAFMALE